MGGIHEEVTPLPSLAWPTVPTGYAGCVTWGDALLLTGMQTGDPLASWPDPITPMARPVAQAVQYLSTTGANVPTYQAAGLNGKPTVRFVAASAQTLATVGSFYESFDPSGAPFAGTGNFYTSNARGITILILAKPRAFPATLGIVFERTAHNTDISQRIRLDVAGTWVIQTKRLDADPTVTGTFPAVIGTPRLIHLGSDFTNGVTRVWVDGVLTLTLPITAGLGDPQYSAGTALGSVIGGGGVYADCDLSYFAMWKGYYDKAALSTLLTSVAARYSQPYTP